MDWLAPRYEPICGWATIALVAIFLVTPAPAQIFTKPNTDTELNEALYCMSYFARGFPSQFDSTAGMAALETDLGRLIASREPAHVAGIIAMHARSAATFAEPTDFQKMLCGHRYLRDPPDAPKSN